MLMLSTKMEQALTNLFDVMLMEQQGPVESSCHLVGLAMAVLARRVGANNARDIITRSMEEICNSVTAPQRLQ